VHKCLQKLRADKSPGVDDISPRMLVEISEEIVVPLTIIFEESLMPVSAPSSRKAEGTHLKITDLSV